MFYFQVDLHQLSYGIHAITYVHAPHIHLKLVSKDRGHPYLHTATTPSTNRFVGLSTRFLRAGKGEVFMRKGHYLGMATGRGFPDPVEAPPRSGENSPPPLGNGAGAGRKTLPAAGVGAGEYSPVPDPPRCHP